MFHDIEQCMAVCLGCGKFVVQGDYFDETQTNQVKRPMFRIRLIVLGLMRRAQSSTRWS